MSIWIASHINLRYHPKTIRLRQTLAAKDCHIVGHLICLWHWVAEYAFTGDLSRFSDQEIADAAGWTREADKFVRALVHCGFLDRAKSGLRVHDWMDFCGDPIKKRIDRSTERRTTADNVRQRQTMSANGRQCPPIIEDRIVEKNKNNTNTMFDFEALWGKYPRPEGKKEALRHFCASVKTDQDYQNIQKAMKNYLCKIETEKIEPKFIKMGSTWFNNWGDWIDYRGEKNVSNDSAGISSFTDDFKRARELRKISGLRKIGRVSAGSILSGVGNLPMDENKSGDHGVEKSNREGNV
jgi:hypothetical protein